MNNTQRLNWLQKPVKQGDPDNTSWIIQHILFMELEKNLASEFNQAHCIMAIRPKNNRGYHQTIVRYIRLTHTQTQIPSPILMAPSLCVCSSNVLQNILKKSKDVSPPILNVDLCCTRYCMPLLQQHRKRDGQDTTRQDKENEENIK